MAKRGRKAMSTQHVLKLDEKYYITCDSRTFILKEVSTLTDKDGNKLPDDNRAYDPDLCGIIQCAIRRMIRIPADCQQIAEKQEHLYQMIMDRIPFDVKPKDLFEDCMVDSQED